MKKMKCISFLNRNNANDSIQHHSQHQNSFSTNSESNQVLFDTFLRAAKSAKDITDSPSSHNEEIANLNLASSHVELFGSNLVLTTQERQQIHQQPTSNFSSQIGHPLFASTKSCPYEFRPVGAGRDAGGGATTESSDGGASSRPASSSTTDTREEKFSTRRRRERANKERSSSTRSKKDQHQHSQKKKHHQSLILASSGNSSPHDMFNINSIRETDILNDDDLCSPLVDVMGPAPAGGGGISVQSALLTSSDICPDYLFDPVSSSDYQIRDPLASPTPGDEDFYSYDLNTSCPEDIFGGTVSVPASESSNLVYGYWEQGGERVVWEYHNVQLTRVPTYGFGIAVSGGRDNPHFRNGDPSVAISEVLKSGPAEGKLEVNDRLISANGMSLENVDYVRAVQILRDSGQSVHLVVKRRIVLPATPEPQTLKVTLTKNKKKDDFGIVLGCRIYVKEILNRTIADKDGGLKEGDVLLKINNSSTENLSMKEARKLVEGTKERLQLLVRRDNPGYSPQFSPDLLAKDISDTRPNYSTQNLYVQPPTRETDNYQRSKVPFPDMDSKSNLRRYNPPFGFSADGFAFDEINPEEPTPPRPPLPRPEDYYTQNAPNSPAKGQPPPEPRFVSFKKEGSVGIRLTGGNDVGIFVTAVQPKSQAQLQGLIAGDKILKVNDMDMTGVTREEAVLYLMSLQEQIDLIVQTRLSDYQQILSSQKGDLFYIRTHFHYEPSGKSELSFRSGDIFRVVDTLHNGVVGAWQVYRIGRNNQETQKGIIPNKARAEELATAQFNAAKKEQTQSESRSGFFKRRRNSRRSKSLGKDHWEDVVFADSVSKFPAYERVSLKHPGFVRPVVLFGPVSDLSRDKMLKENAEKFASPQLDSSGEKPSGIIRLSAIREILERGKHAILDITPNAVDRLNYAQFYPIVIFLRAETKQIVKELRSGMPKGRMSSKKLFDQSVKLEKLWSHVFTATISLTQPEMWYKKMKEIIDKQQSGPIWMSEAKPSESLTDDFLFPMTSRLSYASSPESDLETGPESTSRTPSKSPNRLGGGSSSSPAHEGGHMRDSRGRLVKSSSDPSIAAQEEPLNGPSISQPGPPPYPNTPSRMSPYDVSGIPLGPNAHDDLKSRMNPHQTDNYGRYNRSLSQPPQYPTEDPYSNQYKPVPPPKPKHYRGGNEGGPPWGGYSETTGGHRSKSGGFDRGAYQSNGGLSDDYSGLDSGQGSSLDRKYETLGRTNYSKGTANRGGAYYLNVPPPRDQKGAGGRDLPNHDHRGSAFELYKKPTDPRNALIDMGAHMQPGPPPPGGPYPGQMMHPGFSTQVPSYMDQGSR